MIGLKQIKLLAYGIVSLMVAYWITAWASASNDYLASGEGMTVGIIAIFSISFLAMLYFFKA